MIAADLSTFPLLKMMTRKWMSTLWHWKMEMLRLFFFVVFFKMFNMFLHTSCMAQVECLLASCAMWWSSVQGWAWLSVWVCVGVMTVVRIWWARTAIGGQALTRDLDLGGSLLHNQNHPPVRQINVWEIKHSIQQTAYLTFMACWNFFYLCLLQIRD